ncbi:hypothetical protein BDW59DRAFT_154796 [Aspergillus cavernicola]|uniref:Uncharacterized protein n=1 Tax=Aspergillus cavernicola TaxID=176166 RepID=A0ABR4HDM1_9EURO
MNQPTLHPSPLKEGRRILSEKSANACLSPARSPVKCAPMDSQSPKKLLPSPSFVAQKRSITQVDGEDSKTHGTLRVQRVDSRLGAATAPLGSTAARHILPDSPDAMNLDEQTEPQQQHLHQTNLDTNHAQLTSKATESTTTPPQIIPSDAKTRKLFIQEKATLLRNRLQNAMRHVQNPQFDRRLSELDAHSRKYPRLSGSASSLAQQEREEHLKRKYDGEDQEDQEEEEEEEEEEDDDDLTLSTPRPSQQIADEDVQDEEEEETTPTQETHAQLQRTVGDRPASPTQMLLSSPTYNSNPARDAQSARYDDDRPRERTVETSPSSQRGEGDGDAVDGLLKLMGTKAGTRV